MVGTPREAVQYLRMAELLFKTKTSATSKLGFLALRYLSGKKGKKQNNVYLFYVLKIINHRDLVHRIDLCKTEAVTEFSASNDPEEKNPKHGLAISTEMF